MTRRLLLLTHLLVLLAPLANAGETMVISDDLSVRQISPHCYIHVSNLYLDDGTNVECNGLIVVDGGKALVLDTPSSDSLCRQLISWIEKELHAHVEGVVVNHYHRDCLGGLQVFIDHGCKTYGSDLTWEVCMDNNIVGPSTHFKDKLVLNVGGVQVFNAYVGPAHSPDNIVSYVIQDSVLFGGCMVKALGAGYGNLSDADLPAWPKTVADVKATFPDIKIVVPGHGLEGGLELLDYTVTLISKKN